jgi:hypothetical protein
MAHKTRSSIRLGALAAVLVMASPAFGALMAPTTGLGSYLQAQDPLVPERFAFSPDGSYDASIPSPAGFLGYELGTQFTRWADVVAYLQALDAASDRVTMQEYGRTYENRPLYTLVITTPSNHDRLEEIRIRNLALADPASLSEADVESNIAGHPVITWLSYNVHGNEASSTEASMQVAYRLAAGSDPEVEGWLSESVIILDPGINPDGRDRYVNWYRSVQSHILTTDSRELEHSEPWPGGRTNHYWFDLNRDWVWLVHPESRGRVAAYQRWLPQVHVDHHEQGFNDNYFTHPGTTPRNLQLPDEYERWDATFGRANTDAFDRNRLMYATGESFDFFYPGYGSSYPSVMGGIGMLVEQGGGGRGARAVETNDGYLLTLRQRVFDHYTTSLATVETAAENRVGLLRYFRAAFSQSTNKSPVAAYVFPDDPARSPYLYDVVGMLLQHGVRVERADAGFTLTDARDYWDDVPRRRSFEAGSFIVRGDQPRHLFVNTVLQRNLAIEDSVMYDMATWSAPLAYNLDAYWTATGPGVASTPVTERPTHASGVVNPGASYAYAVEWRQRGAPRALAKLWDAGYRVRFAQRPFSDGAHDFGPGSLIVLLGRNPEGLDAGADMERIAREAAVQIVGLNSGRMASGIDLGSDYSRPIPKPEIALLVDRPISSYSAGFLWYLFDRDTELGITRLRANALGSVDLDDFDVLIIPSAGGLGGTLDDDGLERLERWVRGGGTLVATQGSALFLTEDRSGFTGVEVTPDPDAGDDVGTEAEEDGSGDPGATLRYEDRERYFGLQEIPGSALRGLLDTSHPLAAGLPERVYPLKFGTDALAPAEGLQTVGYYDGDPSSMMAAGYASDENLEKLAGQAFAAVQPMGGGRVVFLLDDTQYRMFWVGASRLMLNAVMLAPGF